MSKSRLLYRCTVLFRIRALSMLLVIGLLAAPAPAETLPITTIQPSPSLDEVLITASTSDWRPHLLSGSRREAIVAEGRVRNTFSSSDRERTAAVADNKIDDARESRWPLVGLIGLLGIGAALTLGGVYLIGPLSGARGNRARRRPQMMLQ